SAAAARNPSGIAVGRIDSIEVRIDEGVEDSEGRFLVDSPSEHVAAKHDRGKLQVGFAKAAFFHSGVFSIANSSASTLDCIIDCNRTGASPRSALFIAASRVNLTRGVKPGNDRGEAHRKLALNFSSAAWPGQSSFSPRAFSGASTVRKWECRSSDS